MDVEVPKSTSLLTPEGKVRYCTEVAFEHLLVAAAMQFGRVDPTMGLMYLKDQEVTKQFQTACRAVLRLQGAEF